MTLMKDEESTTQLTAVRNCTEKCELDAVNTLCLVCSTNMTACSGRAAEQEPDEPEEPQEKRTGVDGIKVAKNLNISILTITMIRNKISIQVQKRTLSKIVWIYSISNAIIQLKHSGGVK